MILMDTLKKSSRFIVEKSFRFKRFVARTIDNQTFYVDGATSLLQQQQPIWGLKQKTP